MIYVWILRKSDFTKKLCLESASLTHKLTLSTNFMRDYRERKVVILLSNIVKNIIILELYLCVKLLKVG